MYICLSICISVYLSIHLSIYHVTYISIYVYILLYVCLSIYLYVYLYAYLSMLGSQDLHRPTPQPNYNKFSSLDRRAVARRHQTGGLNFGPAVSTTLHPVSTPSAVNTAVTTSINNTIQNSQRNLIISFYMYSESCLEKIKKLSSKSELNEDI